MTGKKIAALLIVMMIAAPLVQAATDWQEMTPESKAAARRGLMWLVNNQQKNGSWITGSGAPDHLGVMGLANLAIMSAGNTPGKGEFGREVALGVEFIMSHSQANGCLSIQGRSTMYNHGLSTLCLAEAYGMTQNRKIRAKLVAAVDFIVEAQNQAGGWDYEPTPQGGRNDTSISVMQMMAIRAAVNAGIYVPEKTIQQGIKGIRNNEDPNGGFGYCGRAHTVPMSSAGAAALQAAGKLTWDMGEEGKPVRMALDRLLADPGAKTLPGGVGSVGGSSGGGNYYAVYYYSQAMFQAGDKYWKSTYPTLRDNIVKDQTSQGCWNGAYGTLFSSAIATMALHIPNRYLPIFQEERD